ncbi:META domain-containing protein [Georgenia sp. M64]|uniref:META domain-containing protein n=1 Tax=Georgenia sp. M64 TaxID=3120520 RepID=UPI0030DEBD31
MLERVGADRHHTAAGAPAERDTPVGAWGVRSRGRPSLVLEPDGAVHGSDGCNRLAGSWSSGPDGAVVLGPLASTRMACDGVDTWLSGAAAARVVTGRLEVRDAAGRVLGSLGRDQSAAAAEISST